MTIEMIESVTTDSSTKTTDVTIQAIDFATAQRAMDVLGPEHAAEVITTFKFVLGYKGTLREDPEPVHLEMSRLAAWDWFITHGARGRIEGSTLGKAAQTDSDDIRAFNMIWGPCHDDPAFPNYTLERICEVAAEYGWTPTYQPTTEELTKKRAEIRYRRRHAQEIEEQARERVAAIWDGAERVNRDGFEHPYLERKKVKAYGLRLHKGSLVVPLRNVDHQLMSLQFISGTKDENGNDKYLAKDAPAKGAFHVIGSLHGMKGELASKTVILCEGYATGATIAEVMKLKYPVIVCVSAGNIKPVMDALHQAYPTLDMLIAGDNDALDRDGTLRDPEDNTGLQKARSAAKSGLGFSAYCVPKFDTQSERYISDRPTDFNDLANWNKAGVDKVRDQIRDGLNNIRKIVITGRNDIAKVVDQIEGILNQRGCAYKFGGRLVVPCLLDHPMQTHWGRTKIEIPPGRLYLPELTVPWLRELLNRFVKFYKINKKGEEVECVAPTMYLEAFVARKKDINLPVLKGTLSSPTIRKDGTLLTEDGFDHASGLYLSYNAAGGVPLNIPDKPTREDCFYALQELKKPFAEFRFEDPKVDLSVALASVLTAVMRRSLPTAPMFAIDSPTPGSGKGKIVKIASIIATGQDPSIIHLGDSEVETEKRLGAALMAGLQLVSIDNITKPVDSDFLCTMLTERQINPRILGRSNVPTLETTITLFATGNNLQIKGDVKRRAVVCRIDPRCARPDARKFSMNIERYCMENRANLLGAALTILRGYAVAGRPNQDLPDFGSFTDWSDWVRSSLVWLNQADPCASRQKLEDDDPISSALKAIIPLWFNCYKSAPMTVSKVLAEMDQVATGPLADLKGALLTVAANRKDPTRIDPTRLGRWLNTYKGRVIEDNSQPISTNLRFMQAGKSREGVAIWKIELLDSSQETAGVLGSAEVKIENMFSGKKIDDENFRLKNEKGDLTPSNPSTPAPVPDPLPPPRLRPDRDPSFSIEDAMRDGAEIEEYAFLLGYKSVWDKEFVAWLNVGLADGSLLRTKDGEIKQGTKVVVKPKTEEKIYFDELRDATLSLVQVMPIEETNAVHTLVHDLKTKWEPVMLFDYWPEGIPAQVDKALFKTGLLKTDGRRAYLKIWDVAVIGRVKPI